MVERMKEYYLEYFLISSLGGTISEPRLKRFYSEKDFPIVARRVLNRIENLIIEDFYVIHHATLSCNGEKYPIYVGGQICIDKLTGEQIRRLRE